MIIVAVIMNKKKVRVIQIFFVSLVCSLTFELDYLPKSLLHINPLMPSSINWMKKALDRVFVLSWLYKA